MFGYIQDPWVLISVVTVWMLWKGKLSSEYQVASRPALKAYPEGSDAVSKAMMDMVFKP